MASIYKRGRDSNKRHACYYVAYINHEGKQKTEKGFTDRGLTEQLGARLENEAMLRRKGLVDANKEKSAEQRQSSINEFVESFEKSLKRKSNSAKHVSLTISRVKRIISEGDISCPADIELDTVEEVLAEMVESGRIGNKTHNHYAQAIDQFCKWLCDGRRQVLPNNPLNGLTRLNPEIDVRHPRRALSPEEFSQLVQSSLQSGVEIQCYNGEQRARIYLISYFTGLRRKEIGSLTPNSFDLQQSPPTLTVEAKFSKHRRKDVLPIHPELAAMLPQWLADKCPTKLLFPSLGKRRTWQMVKLDLERVGIPYQTEDGIADFHAAGRHTHITQLLRNGATLVEAKELARHSDVRTTMKYTHVGIDDQANALKSLPSPRQNDWQCIGSTQRVPGRHNMSSNDIKTDDKTNPSPRENRGERQSSTSFDTDWHQAATCGVTDSIPAASTSGKGAFSRKCPFLLFPGELCDSIYHEFVKCV